MGEQVGAGFKKKSRGGKRTRVRIKGRGAAGAEEASKEKAETKEEALKKRQNRAVDRIMRQAAEKDQRFPGDGDGQPGV